MHYAQESQLKSLDEWIAFACRSYAKQYEFAKKTCKHTVDILAKAPGGALNSVYVHDEYVSLNAVIKEREQLIELLKWLPANGIRRVKDTKPRQSEYSALLSFSFKHGDVKVNLAANFADAKCKRVQVGVKTVEQPIYEIQCEGESPLTGLDEPEESENNSEITVDSPG